MLLLLPSPVAVGQSTHRVWMSNAKLSLRSTKGLETSDHLIESLDAARRSRWEESVEKLNFTHSSRKSWSLIRRLGASQRPPGQSRPAVSPNAIASHLLQVAKAPLSKPHRQTVRNEWRQYCRLKIVGLEGDFPEEFTELELDAAIRTVKDGILDPRLKHGSLRSTRG